MTAHRCCPECGAELTTDGGAFCGCVGPFTAEHVDPMHIRPYVDLPEPGGPGPSAPDLEPFARCGTGETAELPVLVPPGQSHAAGRGSAQELSASRAGGHRRAKGRGASVREDGGRRRRPGVVALAAAGVVAALGAGLLTTQALTDSDSGDDRSLSKDDRALPDVPSGGPTEEPSRTGKQKRDDKPSATASSRAGSTSPRADRDSDGRTGREAVSPSVPSSAPDRSSGSSSADGDRDGDRGRYPQHPPRPPSDDSEDSETPSGPTLRAGDTGEEVAELQRRLKQAGALEQGAPEDGVYSEDVQRAVARYQGRNHVRGDDFGEYGPSTRRALESQTAG
ncbi:MAG TPA: peptidoglycan-binding protein [Streptomyces sp.]|nr:peptidoglycan-binding protein [Streptomyces sp.]